MGFLGGLIDSFTGKGAEKQLQNQRGAITSGRDTANSEYTRGETGAQGYLQPYRDQGGNAFKTYGDTLGINGADARDAAQKTYLSDPVLQRQLDLQQKQRGQVANARGGWGSGADALAASRVNLQGYGDWQNRLGQMGQQGQAAAGQGANIAEWGASGRAGSDMGAANSLAQSYGESAKNSNTLAQNMIGLGGLAVSAYTGVPVGRPASSNNLGSQVGTASNGGWSTQTTAAPQPSWYSPSRWFS